MLGAGRRRTVAVLGAAAFCVAVALVSAPASLTGSAGAQEPAPPTTLPPLDPNATPPTAPPPSEVLPSTSTIVPLNCTPIAPPYLVFVGRVTAFQLPTFRFQVDRVLEGTWDGPLIDVDFPDDAGFLRIGPTYQVAAQVDPATNKLYSKVRFSFRNQPGPGTCPGDDPIITRLSDGTPIDTGLLSGMSGRWNKVLLAFLVPSLAVIGALVVVVSLKHVVMRVLKTSAVSSRRYPE